MFERCLATLLFGGWFSVVVGALLLLFVGYLCLAVVFVFIDLCFTCMF